MHDMTASNLRSAYGGESMAHLRYRIWGAEAAQHGYANVARLFKAISHAEEIHARGHFSRLRTEAGGFPVTSMAGFGLGSTSDNLQGAIEGETFEINEMYPAYLQVADLQGENVAKKSFHYAYSAEKVHAALFKKAKDAITSSQDMELGPVQICEVCGYTTEGGIPDVCPLCGAKASQFRTFA